MSATRGDLCADDVGDFHEAGGVVAFGFGELVEDKPYRFIEFGDDDVLEDVYPPSGHLKLGGEEACLLFLLGQFN